MKYASPKKDTKVSFEFFPPRTVAMKEQLWRSIQRLRPLKPQFVSVTYGAGGSTRDRTHETLKKIRKETDLKPAAHLTCVGSSREDINKIAHTYWEEKICHLVALRGDSPDMGSNDPHPEGYEHASDLVEGLMKIADFEITVAVFPEIHPESSNLKEDLDNLKRKIDAGAQRAISQFFFDPNVFLDFLNKVRSSGIKIPIIPGILPVTNCEKVIEFSKKSGTSVPGWMKKIFQGLDQDPVSRQLVAATIAAEQCKALQDNGINEFHFYTLNRADLSYAICHILGLRINSR